MGVVVGDVHRTSKHQMLEEVGKARMVGVLIACSHIVEHVQSHHLCILVFGMDDAESVV